MREPFETLLSHYHGHWSMGPHLEGREPDWAKLLHPSLFGSLSTSEQKMLHIALAIYNGDREATVADLAGLDRPHLNRVLGALYLTTVGRLGTAALEGFKDEWGATVQNALDRDSAGKGFVDGAETAFDVALDVLSAGLSDEARKAVLAELRAALRKRRPEVKG